MCMFCKSLFVPLSVLFWPLCCLFLYVLILITPLVSLNSSYQSFYTACSLLCVPIIEMYSSKTKVQLPSGACTYSLSRFWTSRLFSLIFSECVSERVKNEFTNIIINKGFHSVINILN